MTDINSMMNIDNDTIEKAKIRQQREAAILYCQQEDADFLIVDYIKRTLPITPKGFGRGRPRQQLTEEERILKYSKTQQLRSDRKEEVQDALIRMFKSEHLEQILRHLKAYAIWLPTDGVPVRYNEDGYQVPSHDEYEVSGLLYLFKSQTKLPAITLLLNAAERVGLLQITVRGRSETWYMKTNP